MIARKLTILLFAFIFFESEVFFPVIIENDGYEFVNGNYGREQEEEIKKLVTSTYEKLLEKTVSLGEIYSHIESKSLFRIKTQDSLLINRVYNVFKVLIEKKHDSNRIRKALHAINERDMSTLDNHLRSVCNQLPEVLKDLGDIKLLKNFFLNPKSYDNKKFFEDFKKMPGSSKKKVIQFFSSCLLELNYYLDSAPHVSWWCCVAYTLVLLGVVSVSLLLLTVLIVKYSVPDMHWAWISVSGLLCVMTILLSCSSLLILESEQCEDGFVSRLCSIRGQLSVHSMRKKIKKYIKTINDMQHQLVSMQLDQEKIVIEIDQ